MFVCPAIILTGMDGLPYMRIKSLSILKRMVCLYLKKMQTDGSWRVAKFYILHKVIYWQRSWTATNKKL